MGTNRQILQGKGNVIMTKNSKWKFPLSPLPFFLPFFTHYPFQLNQKTSFTPTLLQQNIYFSAISNGFNWLNSRPWVAHKFILTMYPVMYTKKNWQNLTNKSTFVLRKQIKKTCGNWRGIFGDLLLRGKFRNILKLHVIIKQNINI